MFRLFFVTLAFLGIVAVAEAQTRPMPRPETTKYTFADGDDFVTISISNYGDGFAGEHFDGVYRPAILPGIVSSAFEDGGTFPYIVDYTGEGGQISNETAITYRDAGGVLTLSLLGGVSMPLISRESIP